MQSYRKNHNLQSLFFGDEEILSCDYLSMQMCSQSRVKVRTIIFVMSADKYGNNSIKNRLERFYAFKTIFVLTPNYYGCVFDYQIITCSL